MVADETIDSLEFYWNCSYTPGPWTRNGPRIKSCPLQLHLLEDALTLQYWEIHLEFWSKLIVKQLFSSSKRPPQKFQNGKEAQGITRENDPTNEIVISDFFSEVRMSSPAFERLMNRYFQVILDGIPKYKKKWLSSHPKLWSQLSMVARLLQIKIGDEQNLKEKIRRTA